MQAAEEALMLYQHCEDSQMFSPTGHSKRKSALVKGIQFVRLETPFNSGSWNSGPYITHHSSFNFFHSSYTSTNLYQIIPV